MWINLTLHQGWKAELSDNNVWVWSGDRPKISTQVDLRHEVLREDAVLIRQHASAAALLLTLLTGSCVERHVCQSAMMGHKQDATM
mmetsp:Transcript_43067/g.78309  ORF Transcript_43067/g.78309 Transcript_43067/m.78309 type:complete len:86 (-) Transcript_43067:54-311(-)